MSVRARQAAPARPQPRPRPAPRRPEPVRAPRRAARRRARPRMGLLWIPLIALLLGGIVWVNVAKLQLTTETSRVLERQQRVQAETVRLRAALGQRNALVVERARDTLGMQLPESTDVTFLDTPVR